MAQWPAAFAFAHGMAFSSRAYGLGNLCPRPVAGPKNFQAERLYFLWIGLGLILPAAAEGAITRSWLGVGRGFVWGG